MTDRLPFDPSRIRPPDPPAPPSGVLSPRLVNEMVRGAIESRLPSTLHVLGEIGDLSRPGSGHVYFSLKDDAGELRCVMWRSAAAKLRFEPQAGLEVIATGGVEVYTPRGQYQLVVRKLEPRGVGALELALRQLREKLEKEGLFDARRKRPLPAFPRRVALITSPSGAALRDVLKTLRRRAPWVEVLLLPVRVQGSGAGREIADAIRLLSRHSGDAGPLGEIDALIVGRGGGSLEDLWAFNDEAVVRALAECRIPSVSAVGHEIDWTLSDLAADVRAATPTAAAEILAPDQRELRRQIEVLLRRALRETVQQVHLARVALRERLAAEPLARPVARLHNIAQQIDEHEQTLRSRLLAELGTSRRRLHETAGRLASAGPVWRAARAAEHLRQSLQRLPSAVKHLLERRAAVLAARRDVLAACDPRRVLRRGYSITRDARSGKVLRSMQGVRDGQRLSIELADGTIRATADDPRQPSLFDVPPEE